nr:root allergen protein-like [Tanacetum cinerariifolium]
MSVINSELEVTSSLPADKLFKLFLNFDTLAPKVEPHVFKSIDLVEGDGGVGSIKSTTYGDAVPYTSAKHKIDAVDASNFSVTYTVFEGDALLGILDSATHHIKFVPSADGGAVFKHCVVVKCKGDAKPTEETLNQFKESFKNTFKALDALDASNTTITFDEVDGFESLRFDLSLVFLFGIRGHRPHRHCGLEPSGVELPGHGSTSSVGRKSNTIFTLPGHGSTSSVGRKSNTIFALPGHESTSFVRRKSSAIFALPGHRSMSFAGRESNAIFALPGHRSTSSVGRESNTIFALPGHKSTSSAGRKSNSIFALLGHGSTSFVGLCYTESAFIIINPSHYPLVRNEREWYLANASVTPTIENVFFLRGLYCLATGNQASEHNHPTHHRRLGHLNFKTRNKLVRHNLVKGLPTKCFENDHTCTACLKGKQHKASYNLGRFEEKGDEGYFIGYSMSSKAFRVFNKRTRRVEENLHLEFLENKAIEKESSLSKPQDRCSTKVPEGSGNPNPTASTSNPPADLMEILTVESPILTFLLDFDSSAIFLAVASLLFWQWQPSSLALGTSSANGNSIPGSGNALCILFQTILP